MGFVAAAASSFLFPDFIVFRFTQAVVWAIALTGLVLLCGVSGQFSFAQAALYGMGAYSAAILANHTASTAARATLGIGGRPQRLLPTGDPNRTGNDGPGRVFWIDLDTCVADRLNRDCLLVFDELIDGGLDQAHGALAFLLVVLEEPRLRLFRFVVHLVRY